MDSLLRAASGPTSPAARQRYKHGKNFRRNTLVSLAICLIILGFASSPVTLAQLIPLPFVSVLVFASVAFAKLEVWTAEQSPGC